MHYLGLDLLPLCDEARIRDGQPPQVQGVATMTPVRTDVECADCLEMIHA